MNLVGTGVALIVSGGACALAMRRSARAADAMFRLLVVAGCGVAAIGALRVLCGGPSERWTVEPLVPGGAWSMAVDALSAWFLLSLTLVGGVTTVFGVAYMERERAHRSVAAAHATWALLLAAMMLVLVAQSAVLFLMAWEVMAVSAYFLIVIEHHREEVRRSGLLYLVLTHLGTLALLVMFLSWGRAASSFAFADFAAARAALPWAGAGVLLLALVGFGIKAGLFPFHFWLPGAHAAAPSHVSALLSGVMLKMGVYGLFRVLAMVGLPPLWWASTVLLLGLASAVFGVLWALAQHDLKRALAYSSVENVGIIAMGLGLGALGAAYHRPAVALLGFAAALLHTLNHALFKSLLFLGAGAVAHATGTREIDRLGGLARRMPRTALAFLVGSIAIVGLPPLNGFVSEWTLVQGFLNAGRMGGPLRLASLGAAGVGLVGGLALACFVRLGGIVFLGQPRDRSLGEANDGGAGMVFPMLFLGGACMFIGLAPRVVLGLVARVAGPMAGAREAYADLPGMGNAALGVSLLGASIPIVALALWAVRAFSGVRAKRRSAATWGCAYAESTPRMQYTARSFSSALFGALPAALVPESAGPSGAFRTTPQDRILSIARPLWSRIQSLAVSVRTLQQGRVTTYLQYMIWTVLLMLGFLLFASTVRHP